MRGLFRLLDMLSQVLFVPCLGAWLYERKPAGEKKSFSSHPGSYSGAPRNGPVSKGLKVSQKSSNCSSMGFYVMTLVGSKWF